MHLCVNAFIDSIYYKAESPTLFYIPISSFKYVKEIWRHLPNSNSRVSVALIHLECTCKSIFLCALIFLRDSFFLLINHSSSQINPFLFKKNVLVHHLHKIVPFYCVVLQTNKKYKTTLYISSFSAN